MVTGNMLPLSEGYLCQKCTGNKLLLTEGNCCQVTINRRLPLADYSCQRGYRCQNGTVNSRLPLTKCYNWQVTVNRRLRKLFQWAPRPVVPTVASSIPLPPRSLCFCYDFRYSSDSHESSPVYRMTNVCRVAAMVKNLAYIHNLVWHYWPDKRRLRTSVHYNTRK